jgi:hypothetical protein
LVKECKMNHQEIVKLKELLENYLGSTTKSEITNLTARDENYGSHMLALKLHVRNETHTETVGVIAKTPPPAGLLTPL